MVEYSFDEAIALLTNNVLNAEKNLSNLVEDLDFLKDQITTSEVSILHQILLFSFTIVDIARIFNFDVKQRRSKKITA
jgi:hypothetical protein